MENEHLFYGVELVVYCEGVQVEGEASTLDEVFWEQILSQNGKSVYCKSMGAKSDLLSIAETVIDKEVANVVVAMDRDYDDIRNELIEHPQVLYSYGYSWESDVMLDFNFDNALALFVTTTHRAPIRDEFLEFRERQSRCLRRIFAIDYKYIGHTGMLFNRQKPLSIIASSGNSEPHVKIKVILEGAKALGSYQTAPLPSPIYQSACGVRSFFGKAVSRLVFHWFIYRTKRIAGVRKAYYDAFMNLLASTLDISDVGIPRNAYYADAIAKI